MTHGKKSGTCYSACYTRETRGQKRFTISKVAADWHQLIIPQRTMRPSIARVSERLNRGLQRADMPPLQSATLGLYVVVSNLLLIFHPSEGRKLSWPEHIVMLAAFSRLPANDQQWESNLKVTSRHQPLNHSHLHRQVGVNSLPRVVTC